MDDSRVFYIDSPKTGASTSQTPQFDFEDTRPQAPQPAPAAPHGVGYGKEAVSSYVKGGADLIYAARYLGSQLVEGAGHLTGSKTAEQVGRMMQHDADQDYKQRTEDIDDFFGVKGKPTTGESIVGGVARFAPKMALGALGASATQGLDTAGSLENQGQSKARAYAGGAADALGTLLSFKVPNVLDRIPGLKKTISTRVIGGAVGMSGVGAAIDLTMKDINQNHPEIAKQYSPTDLKQRVTDAITGAIIGAVHHGLSPKPAKVERELPLKGEGPTHTPKAPKKDIGEPVQHEMDLTPRVTPYGDPSKFVVDENGIPHRADLSHDVQRAQSQHQGDLFEDADKREQEQKAWDKHQPAQSLEEKNKQIESAWNARQASAADEIEKAAAEETYHKIQEDLLAKASKPEKVGQGPKTRAAKANAFKQGGSVDPSVFKEGYGKLKQFVSEKAKLTYADESKQTYDPSATPKTKQLADMLHTLRTMRTEAKTVTRVGIEEFHKDVAAEGFDPKELSAKFQEHAQGLNELTPREAELYDKWYSPMLGEYRNLLKEVSELRGSTIEIDPSIIPRYAMGHHSWVDRLFGHDDSAAKSFGVGAKPSGLKDRTVHAIEMPDGERHVVTSVKGKNGKWSAVAWHEGESKDIGKIPRNLRNGDEISGGEFEGGKIGDANTKEIEHHTDIRYLPGGVETIALKSEELSSYKNEMEGIRKIVNSDLMQEHMADEHGDHPDNWRHFKGQEKFPALKGKVFDPKTAEVFEDFFGNEPYFKSELLRRFNNFIVKTFIAIPIGHMLNEGGHWIPSRGWDWIKASGWANLAKTAPKAFNSVLEHDSFQAELAKNGASTTYPGTLNAQYWEKQMQGVWKDWEKQPLYRKALKQLGITGNAVSMASARAMWATRDVLYTQLVMERMNRGETMPDAIKNVEKHMPSYRIPSRVLGSRGLSKVMHDPSLTVFSAYHYGLLNSFGEHAKSVINFHKNPKEGAEALGQILALAGTYAFLYPKLDGLYTWAARESGMIGKNDHIQSRRAGPAAVIKTVSDVMTDKKTVAAMATSFLTPTPVAQSIIELALDRIFYNGKGIVDPSDPLEKQAMDLAHYLGSRLDFTRLGQDVSAGKKTLPQAIVEKGLDVSVKTEEGQLKQQRAERFRERARRRRENKWRVLLGD